MDARADVRTDDGRKVITIAHPEQSSGELTRYLATGNRPVQRVVVESPFNVNWLNYSN